MRTQSKREKLKHQTFLVLFLDTPQIALINSEVVLTLFFKPDKRESEDRMNQVASSDLTPSSWAMVCQSR